MTLAAFRSIVLPAALVLLAAPAMAASLAPSGRSVTEERTVSGFSGISVAVPGRVEVTQGPAEKLTITADDNVLPEIESVVESGILKLRFRRGFNTHGKLVIRIAVSAKKIESLSIAGSGDIVAPALTTTRLAVSVAGSGDVQVGGRTDRLEVSISGSGDVNSAKLEAKTVRVSIAGSGDATVWARDTLRVSVAGSGDVRYLGDPSISKSIMGSGSIRRAEASPS